MQKPFREASTSQSAATLLRRKATARPYDFSSGDSGSSNATVVLSSALNSASTRSASARPAARWSNFRSTLVPRCCRPGSTGHKMEARLSSSALCVAKTLVAAASRGAASVLVCGAASVLQVSIMLRKNMPAITLKILLATRQWSKRMLSRYNGYHRRRTRTW